MILITGATGQLGKATLDLLIHKIPVSQIAILARDTQKAEAYKTLGVDVRQGDYDNYTSLLEAFKGIDKLLFISGSDTVKRGLQHQEVIRAAKEAGVKHIVYTSFMRRNETETSPIAFVAKSHIDTEKALIESGITYTIMKNTLYAEVLQMLLGEQALKTNITLPAGAGRAAFTARQDMAEAAASIMSTDGHDNATYHITSDTAYSFEDVANVLSEISGSTIAYQDVTAEDYIQSATQAGLPAEYAGMFAGFSTAIKENEFVDTSSDLENLIGRKPTSLQEFLTSSYSK
jgi:NAD(P)H dehydrogenase (quinone)